MLRRPAAGTSGEGLLMAAMDALTGERSIVRRVWRRVLGEKSWVDRFGSFRERERLGLVNRANYAYGMLRAADMAAYFGKREVTVCEFGVANGDGLLNMIELAEPIQAETGVQFRIYGFDTGAGLPSVTGFKDHPEIWNPGDFSMLGKDELMRRIGSRAELIFGDIKDTIGPFIERVGPDAPLGFASIDVDIYSATKSALEGFKGAPDKYLPAVSLYLDDVAFYFANRWCGELAAVAEFNEEQQMRKIDQDRSIRYRAQQWCEHMYVCHILDHAARNEPQSRPKLDIEAHYRFMSERALF